MLLKLLGIFLLIGSIASQSATTYVYKTVGNLSILADLYLPNSSQYAKYPVFFTVHGGAYMLGDKQGACSYQELLEALSLGWSVVSIDYRLNPGVFLQQIVEDMQDAYDWIRNDLAKNVSIDPDNIIVFGQSAGGGLAVMSGYKLLPPPKAIISFYPYCTNFMTPYAYNPFGEVTQALYQEAEPFFEPIITEYVVTNSSDPRNALFLNSLAQQKAGWLLTTHDINKLSEEILLYLSDYSSVLHVSSTYPPTYLCHGLNDTLVPYNQSVEMSNVLQERNITHQLVLVPGVGHSFDYNITPQQWEEYVLPAFTFAQQFITTETIHPLST